MKKKKIENSFDVLVESLINKFSQIENFELIQTDEQANKVWNTIMFRFSDISSFKELVVSHFIPATTKAIFVAKQLISTSKYKQFIKIDNQLYNETYYDTIRNAYVTVFHKLESYVDDVIKMTELLLSDSETTNKTSLDKYAIKTFAFDIRDWRQFYITQKINWIANCVKHYDGYPQKKPTPEFFLNLPSDKRLELKLDDFKSDCELLIEFLPVYLNVSFVISAYQSMYESFNRDEWKEYPDYLITHDATQLIALENVKKLLEEVSKF